MRAIYIATWDYVWKALLYYCIKQNQLKGRAFYLSSHAASFLSDFIFCIPQNNFFWNLPTDHISDKIETKKKQRLASFLMDAVILREIWTSIRNSSNILASVPD